MRQMEPGFNRIVLGLALTALPLTLTGCALKSGSVQPQTYSLSGMHGNVHGGQQPVKGADVYLYAAGTTGYGSAGPNLLTTAVKTGLDGTFTANSTCTAGQQVFLVALHGDPGGGANPNQATVAALGDCAGIGSSTFVQMNELTTVAAAYALAPFAAGVNAIGAPASNVAGLKRAFANAAKLANVASGSIPGALPPGATAPVSKLDSLANVLAACINSQGGAAADTSTPCGKLFRYSTPSGGAAPTDVFGAALNIVKNPTSNVSSLYTLALPAPPFPGGLTSPPSDWTVSVTYTGGALSAPRSTTVDANGQVWIANSGNNTVTVLAQTGSPIGGSPFSGNGLNGPTAIAIDNGGNAWVADTGGGTGTKVSAFTSSGGLLAGSPFTVGTGPSALAFDAPGNLWVANGGSSSLMQLSPSGSLLQTVTGNVTSPNAVVINPK